MSLIGSLEDLGLGDILQIISLSQKSGVLVIRTDDDEGRIVFENGLVRGAIIKDSPPNLRAVLVGGGFLASEEFDAAAWVSEATSISIEEALAQSTSLTSERIESLCRDCIESAVVKMFRWRFGDFNFDLRKEPDLNDPQTLLTVGLNAQYLAMEGARLDDEADCDDREETAQASGAGGASVEDIFAGMGDEDDDDEIKTPVLASEDDAAEAEVVQAGTLEAETDPGTIVASAELADSQPPPPLVMIDADLVALEWMKKTLADRFPRIHIFQSCELGLARVRQYLARAQTPLVLVSPDAPGDRMGGVRNTKDLAKRLKAQASHMLLLWLCEAGTKLKKRPPTIDGVVSRPATHDLRNPKASAQVEEAGVQLIDEVSAYLSRGVESSRTGRVAAPKARSRLQRVTTGLSDAATRGEILPQVITFAAESFSRVAIFVVLDDRVLGLTQLGMERAGGPNEEGIHQVRLKVDDCGWFRSLLDGRLPLRAGPSDDGDRAFAELLGDTVPSEVYLAPIECAGQIVAMLYADNLPDDEPIGDTSAIEGVLQHAGESLDRAAFERALAEVGGGDDIDS
jgi:hypothetical protein